MIFFFKLIIFLFGICGQIYANTLLEVSNISFEDFGTRRVMGVPYIFYSTSTRFSYGGAIVARGYGQKDLSFVASAYGSANDSYGLIAGIYNYKISNISDKLFLDLQHTASDTENSLIYYNTQDGATEDVRGLWYRRRKLAKLTYIYSLKKETTKNNATSVEDLLNLKTYISAFETGAKKVSLSYFDQLMKVESPSGGAYGRTKGVMLTFDNDHRDDQSMPGDGSRLLVDLSFDPGNEDRGEYSKVEVDFAKYISLKSPSIAEKLVLGFNGYYARMIHVDEDKLPSWFAQANLGGDQRLRGYRQSRYFGEDAIYGSTELRLMPKNNIFKNLPLFKYFDIPWWQFSAFFEAGQVDDYQERHEIFSDVKFSYGAGISALVEGIVASVDLAFGEDTYYLRLYVNQSF